MRKLILRCALVYNIIIIKFCLSSWTRPSVSDSVSSTMHFFLYNYVPAFPLSFYTMSYVCIILFRLCHGYFQCMPSLDDVILIHADVYIRMVCIMDSEVVSLVIQSLCIKSLVHHVYYTSWSYVISIYDVLCNPHNNNYSLSSS